MDQSICHPAVPIYKASTTFLWGHLKNLVHATSLDSEEDCVARISEAAARMRETHGNFERVRQSVDALKFASLLVYAILNSYCKHYTWQRRLQ
ncbi:hypothetical protein TNCV_656171 [Trichonephila clavipes]|nr:hypothetical protein TNCV_656171 [Trichonephila clavipes]